MSAIPSTELATLSLTQDLPIEQLRLRSRKMMIDLSYAIEAHAEMSGKGTILLATFQRLSLFRPHITRYIRIATQIRQVFVLGVADTELPAMNGVNVITIEADWPLVQEWCVIARGPSCCVALQSRDVVGFHPKRRSRQFAGRWTTRLEEVDGLVMAFFQAIEQPVPVINSDSLVGFQSAQAIRHLLTHNWAAL